MFRPSIHSVITSLNGILPFNQSLTSVTTTKHVAWLDIRMPKRPLLSWLHHRSFDRSLHSIFIPSSDDSISSILLSNNYPLLSVYNINVVDSCFQSSSPYCLDKAPFREMDGQCLYQTSNNTFELFLRSKLGEISHRTLSLSSNENVNSLNIPVDNSIWSLEVDYEFGDGSDSMRHYIKRDLTKTCNKIFNSSQIINSNHNSNNNNNNNNSNSFNVKTLNDDINHNKYIWHYNIGNEGNFNVDCYKCNDAKDEIESCKELHNDLKSSLNLVGNKKPTLNDNDNENDDDDSGLTRAASAMRINPSSPPKYKLKLFDIEKDFNEATNSLLTEWNLGINPDKYRYRDPYSDNFDINFNVYENLSQNRKPPVIASTKPARPPTVQSTQSQQRTLKNEPPKLSQLSQQIQLSQQMPLPSSQDQYEPPSSMPMPQTQIERGPFGNRNQQAKKKKKKIRGF